MVKYKDDFFELKIIQAGVSHGNVLGPVLYLLYTADLSITKKITTETFADDTSVLAVHEHPSTALMMLQNNLKSIEDWMHKWHIKANEAKFINITFTIRRETCPPVILNGKVIP